MNDLIAFTFGATILALGLLVAILAKMIKDYESNVFMNNLINIGLFTTLFGLTIITFFANETFIGFMTSGNELSKKMFNTLTYAFRFVAIIYWFGLLNYYYREHKKNKLSS